MFRGQLLADDGDDNLVRMDSFFPSVVCEWRNHVKTVYFSHLRSFPNVYIDFRNARIACVSMLMLTLEPFGRECFFLLALLDILSSSLQMKWAHKVIKKSRQFVLFSPCWEIPNERSRRKSTVNLNSNGKGVIFWFWFERHECCASHNNIFWMLMIIKYMVSFSISFLISLCIDSPGLHACTRYYLLGIQFCSFSTSVYVVYDTFPPKFFCTMLSECHSRYFDCYFWCCCCFFYFDSSYTYTIDIHDIFIDILRLLW